MKLLVFYKQGNNMNKIRKNISIFVLFVCVLIMLNPISALAAEYEFRTGSDGKLYWYENGVRQGTYDDPQGVIGDGTVRGREIYDPATDAWYWLDSVYDGAKACGKEVWIPYIYQDEARFSDAEITQNAQASDNGLQQLVESAIRQKIGKWVRYDENGKMLKGWVKIEGALADCYPDQSGNVYYYDYKTGLMAKGDITINGTLYHFDELTGALNNPESSDQEIVGKYSGKGDYVISGIDYNDGIYRAHITNLGSSNFAVWSHSSTKTKLLVNEIGNYDGYVLLQGGAPYTFEIISSGKWSIQIEKLSNVIQSGFSGKGDYVTGLFTPTTNKYHIVHDGTSNFVIHGYSDSRVKLLVNEIGPYDGIVLFKTNIDDTAYFEINADGKWTIEPIN